MRDVGGTHLAVVLLEGHVESMMATDVARETEIAPPVTAVLGESAPRAAQLTKLQDAKTATE